MTTLKKLQDHQDLILLAEIGALIHDLGKLGKEFVIQQSAECFADRTCCPECKFNHEQILGDPNFLKPSLVNLLLDSTWRSRLQSDAVDQLKQAPEHLGHFISGHTKLDSGVGLLALVTRCDQIDSGIDKGALQNSTKQGWNVTFGATAFGYEARRLPVGSNEDGLKVLRDNLTEALTTALSQVRDSKASPAQVRSEVLASVESAFRQALGETRRAANDVTLWDHACSVASLQKAALAQILLKKQWPSNLRELRWRVLRITFDGFRFLERAHHISDLLGRMQAIREALDKVRTLLEVTLPLGNEIYRDENGSAFIVPDIEDLLDWQTEPGHTLRDRIGKEFGRELHDEIQLDLSPEWFSEPSRYGVELGRLLSNPLPPLTVDPEAVRHQWDAHLGVEVCTVCGLRPQGPSTKAKDRNVCDICEQRRGDRSMAWSKKLATTIWTDEVADTNGRLALIVAHFDLTAWLDGHFLSSILAQEPPTSSTTYEKVVAQLAEELKNNVKPDRSNPPLLQRLAPEAFRQPAQDFYQAVVEERDIHGLAAAVARDDHLARAELLLLFLLRKNPSFGRIRRIWETTRTFWQEVLPTDEDGDLAQSLVGQVLRQADPRLPRLEIRGTLQPQRSGDTLGPYHTYELVVKGVRVSLAWDGERFITCDNLDYLAKPEQLGAPLEKLLTPKGTFTLEEPVGYGAKNKVWGNISIEQVKPLDDNYTPAIPILAEPRTFMALVPANCALEVVKAIKKKYEREMGKVRNRLPLTLGVVYFGRRTPLAAALDAGRRMLKRERRQEDLWQVSSVTQGNGWPKEVKLTLSLDGQAMEIAVPTVMGDGATKDLWYPYWCVQGKPNDRKLRFDGPNGKQWVHVSELRKGDQVYFTPSTFDFEFLDTAGRRFEVTYAESGQRRAHDKSQRPYWLEQVDAIEHTWREMSRLSKSQIYQVRDLVEGKRAEWGKPRGAEALALPRDDVFRCFVGDVLRKAGVYSEELERAALSGMLSDALELYLEIMKENPKSGGNHE